MNPKENTLLFEIADKMDAFQKIVDELRNDDGKREARIRALETRINKYERFFFKNLQKRKNKKK
jgi:hypothetical protein